MARPNYHPARPVGSREELDALLVEGLDSGESRPMTAADWEALRKRAMSGVELRKSS
ncbi:hypothetical protein ACNOYE_25175 [Nannocystaceae bacterium ST9]